MKKLKMKNIYTFLLITIFIAFTNSYSQNTWEKTNDLDNLIIWSLAVNSSGDIFAGNGTDGVYRSTDNGVNWLNVGPSLGSYNYKIQTIFINPNDDILIGIDDEFADGGMYISTDNGNNWSVFGIPEHPVTCITVNSSGHIFVGTASVGVYRSTDNGNSWVQINQGLTNNNGNHPTCLLVNSNDEIFTGTMFGGVFRSTDSGENWIQINEGITTNFITSLALNSNGDIFAGTFGQGVFRSTNNGQNWVQINSGIYSEGSYVTSLAINSIGEIFAGTFYGVFHSTNNGDNWVQINNGLTNYAIRSIAINSNDDTFVGTYDGVFRTIPSLKTKVFLQGPYLSSTGTMSTALRTNGYLPLNQPYNSAPLYYNGSESVDSIPQEVVDWILLEIRTDFSSLLSRKAAFLLSDGSIVDLDGVSSVKFPGVAPGNYFIVVRHRNHLAVMTANPVTLSFNPDLYDFSVTQTQAFGTNALKELGVGIFGMCTGDGNGDGFVTSTDFNVFNPKFTSAASGYEYSDWNLDGLVTSTDFNFFNPNFTTAKQSFVP